MGDHLDAAPHAGLARHDLITKPASILPADGQRNVSRLVLTRTVSHSPDTENGNLPYACCGQRRAGRPIASPSSRACSSDTIGTRDIIVNLPVVSQSLVWAASLTSGWRSAYSRRNAFISVVASEVST